MIQVSIIVVSYFLILSFMPWQIFDEHLFFNSSYLFDFIFSVGLIIFTKARYSVKHTNFRLLGIFNAASLFIALVSLLVLKIMSVQHAFSLVDHLFFQMVILAPILEELVFRMGIGELQLKFLPRFKWNFLLNGFIFSLSHALALFVVPDEFIVFIWCQIFYTFVLGMLCFNSFVKTRNPLFPITVHLSFNLCFYLFITLGLS